MSPAPRGAHLGGAATGSPTGLCGQRGCGYRALPWATPTGRWGRTGTVRLCFGKESSSEGQRFLWSDRYGGAAGERSGLTLPLPSAASPSRRRLLVSTRAMLNCWLWDPGIFPGHVMESWCLQVNLIAIGRVLTGYSTCLQGYRDQVFSRARPAIRFWHKSLCPSCTNLRRCSCIFNHNKQSLWGHTLLPLSDNLCRTTPCRGT